MTDPATPPPGPSGDDDVAAVTAELDRGGPGRIAAVVTGIGRALRGVCVLGGATGLLALATAAWAWDTASSAFALAAIVGLATVAVAAYLARRTGQLTDAVTHPGEVLAQAKDLVGRAAGSPELTQLAQRARGRAPLPTGRFARVRRVAASTRTISAVIGLADPDPERHRLLLPFSPVRLRTMWLGAIAGLFLWVGSALVAAAALLSLLLHLA